MPADKKRIWGDEEAVGAIIYKGFEGGIDLVAIGPLFAAVQNVCRVRPRSDRCDPIRFSPDPQLTLALPRTVRLYPTRVRSSSDCFALNSSSRAPLASSIPWGMSCFHEGCHFPLLKKINKRASF